MPYMCKTTIQVGIYQATVLELVYLLLIIVLLWIYSRDYQKQEKFKMNEIQYFICIIAIVFLVGMFVGFNIKK